MTLMLHDMENSDRSVITNVYCKPSSLDMGEDILRLPADVAQSIITSGPVASKNRPLFRSYNGYQSLVYELLQEMRVSIETITRNALLSYFKDNSCYFRDLPLNDSSTEQLIDRANEYYHCLDAPAPPRKVIKDFHALRHTFDNTYAKIVSVHDSETQRHILIDLQELAVSLAQARLSTPPQVDRIGTVRHAFNQTLRSFGLTE